MRLRLEALLQDWPRDERSYPLPGLGLPGMHLGAGAFGGIPGLGPGGNGGSGGFLGGMAGLGGGSGGAGALGIDAADFVGSSGGGGAGGVFGFGSLMGADGGGPTVAVVSGSGISGLGLGRLDGGGGAVAAAAGGLAAAGGGLGMGLGLGLSAADIGSSPPLEQELARRFPLPAGAHVGSEVATIAAAKRCIARLLAWAPPPHQLTFAKLGAQVPKLLGGARIGRNLRLLCLEEPEVFAVQSQVRGRAGR